MPDRIPLDHLTSDQYDALCNDLDALRQVARGYCPHCGRGDAAPTVTDWEQQKKRATQLAALAREILYADHITSNRLADWRDRLDTLTEQQPA